LDHKPTILFISHDANRAGAQLFLLNVMRYFKADGFGVKLLLVNSWGLLIKEFQEEFEVYNYTKKPEIHGDKFTRLLKKQQKWVDVISHLAESNEIDLVYANTIASACILDEIKQKINKPVISHIHELSYSLNHYSSREDLIKLDTNSEVIIACSKAVGENLEKNYLIDAAKLTVVHSFVNNLLVLDISENSDPAEIKEAFGIPEDKFIVTSCGNADWRKGLDIFTLIAKQVLKNDPEVHFVWVGAKNEGELFDHVSFDADKMGISSDISLIPPTDKSIEIMNASDVFLVSSREDPFPLVMLEASLCGKPIVGFENTGGAAEFIEDDAGLLAPYLDIEKISSQILAIKNSLGDRALMGENARKKVQNIYNFEVSMNKIKTIIVENL
jgi:glycosyltransferase involved in cell wall biosynthesis